MNPNLSNPNPNPHDILSTASIEASELARSCQEQLSALSLLASLSQPGSYLDHDGWASLLDAVSGQLRILQHMLESDVTRAKYQLIPDRR